MPEIGAIVKSALRGHQMGLETLHLSPEAKELEAKGAPMLHQLIV